MSEFLVKMDTPNRCCDCPMCYDYMLCRLTGKTFGEIDCVELIADWCPLIKLPPHGRLIDADRLQFIKIFDENDPLDYIHRYAIDNAAIIIPAEDGDVNGIV